jgi:hypothetical protein
MAAVMAKQTYLIVTTTISAQNTSDRKPRTASFPALPDDLRHSRKVYIGLVPISPKTTPSAPITSFASRQLFE